MLAIITLGAVATGWIMVTRALLAERRAERLAAQARDRARYEGKVKGQGW